MGLTIASILYNKPFMCNVKCRNVQVCTSFSSGHLMLQLRYNVKMLQGHEKMTCQAHGCKLQKKNDDGRSRVWCWNYGRTFIFQYIFFQMMTLEHLRWICVCVCVCVIISMWVYIFSVSHCQCACTNAHTHRGVSTRIEPERFLLS